MADQTKEELQAEVVRLEKALAAVAPTINEVIYQRNYARNVLIGTACDMRGLAAFIEAAFSDAVNPNAEVDSLAKALRNCEAMLCDARREIAELKQNTQFNEQRQLNTESRD